MPSFTLFSLSTLPRGQLGSFTALQSFRNDIQSFSGAEIVEYGAATITDTDGNPDHGQDYFYDPDTPGQSMDAPDSYTGALTDEQVEFEESFVVVPSAGSLPFLVHAITDASQTQYYGFVSEGQFDPTLTYLGFNLGGADPGLIPYENLITAAPQNHAFDTYQQLELGLAGAATFNDGFTFVHDGSSEVSTFVVQDNDPVLEDQESGLGQVGPDRGELLQSINGDTTHAGADITSVTSYTVTGSDGSNFKAYIIGSQQPDSNQPMAIGGGDWNDKLYVGFSETLVDGVTYTFSEISAVGQVDYTDLADQESTPSPSEYRIGLHPLEQIPGVPAGSVLAGHAFNTGGTITFSNVGTSVTITDDDEYAEDVAGQTNPETGDNAVLTNDVTIAGSIYSAGTQINAIAQVEVVNDTTGETGFAQIFALGDPTNGPAFVAYPFPVTDGDSLTFTATDNQGEVSDMFGNTQGYAYSAFHDTEDTTPPVAGTPPASDGTPSVSLSEAIFLGNLTDADTNEGFPPSINTAPYLGTFGSPANPLWQDEVLVTYNDVNGDNTINTDNFAGLAQFQEEQISYDIGSGTQNAEIDSIASVNITVTYTDGSTQSYTNALMYQDTNGNMLLVNSDFAGTDLNSPSGIAIQSIDVTSVSNANYGAATQGDFQPFVCFTSGTRIATVSGDRRIEDLVAGDLVFTVDRGYQPIRWIGSSKRPATGDLAPILIRKGALGNNRDLRVSPQHRMLLQGWQADMLFGEEEVLATAKSLVNDHSILRDEGGEAEYFHMLFDTHEIIYAEGAPSESFHPGEQGWKALDQATRDEILTLFPELSDGCFEDYSASARTSLKHSEGQLLGQYMVGRC